MAKKSESESTFRAGRIRFRAWMLGICVLVATVLVMDPNSLVGQGLADAANRLRAAANRGSSRPDAGLNQDSSSETNGASENSPASTTAFGSAPFDLDMLGPLFLEPQSAANSDSAPDLRAEAERSFLAGDQAVARRLMFGHMAADYDSAQSLLRQVKFSKLLGRPVWNIRFGVSMTVRESGPDTEDANPIPVEGQARGVQPTGGGASRQPNSGLSALGSFRGLGNRRARNNSRSRPAANTPAANRNGGLRSLGSAPVAAGDAPADQGAKQAAEQKAERDLDETLGLVAQVVGEEFSTRYERGDFGPLLVKVSDPDLKTKASTAASTSPTAAATNPSLSRLGGALGPLGGNRASSAGPPSQAPAQNRSLSRLAGGGLRPLSGNPTKTPQTPAASSPNRTLPRLGGNSGLRPLGSNPAPAARPGVTNPTAPAENDTPSEPTPLSSPDSLPMWKPGIVFVGSGGKDQMISRAKEAGLDVLIHFEVTLKSSQDEPVQNRSRCRLYLVENGKSLIASKFMDSDEEQSESAKGNGGRTYVDEQLRNLFSVMDREIKVVDLPKMNEERARLRVRQLLSSSQENSMRTLAEIRLYQLKQLLTDKEVELAFNIVGGPESLVFLYGSPEQKAALVRNWAVPAPAKAES